MEFTVRLFGPSADAVGAPSVVVAVEGEATCGVLRRTLGQRYPALEPMTKAGRLAVNHAFASDAQRVRPSDEIALIAMVGGG